MFKRLGIQISDWFIRLGFSEGTASALLEIIEILLVFILAWLSYFAAKLLITRFVHILVKRSKTNWDDILAERKVFKRIAYLAPALLIYKMTPLVIPDLETTVSIIQGMVNIYITVVFIGIMLSLLNGVNDIYQTYEISRTRPIKGFIQVLQIIFIILGIIFVISILRNESPAALLLGLGTLSAVLMLVFKDPILGFVGGIQLTANNMVRIGDWISMPKYGADGNVIDITLTTVKVQNWDKTITTIPTYALVNDYFQNWRGMEESGGRRIMRSINIDMTSVRFCTPEMLEKFKKVQFVSKYVEKRNDEIEAYNKKFNIDNSVLVNGRRQTNLGIFRAYLKEYLRNKPEVDENMTFLVRQLQPTENGIPVQVYVFSRIQQWAKYEDVQSDIFDHILAVIPHFDLRVFQSPTGSDFKALASTKKAGND
ncbi:MAG: mechanosensitive ion channel family protein [Bacteroidales bacterium]|nr:mechanosensitive ion channel family protein [Bacteroidales bacterium]MCF8388431.1 mechanosensitive ion channel family protein [Bacteroidales bacterium]MCF8396952.1 mechanosensitive ion channel family protein [Bacteroidales bacterium]